MDSSGLLWPEIQAAARNLSPAHLTRLGITAADAIAAGGLGVAKISAYSDAHFEIGGEVNALLLPVYWGQIPTKEAPLPDWELEDILAFDPHQPERWWLRRGDACLLGAGALSNQLLGKPLDVYRTPLSWLRAGCGGVVVLDLSLAYFDLVTAQYGLAGEDDAHTNELRRTLTETALHRLPRFLVRDEVVT